MIFLLLMIFLFIGISSLETYGLLNFANFSDPNAPASSDFEMTIIYASAGLGGLTFLAQIVLAISVSMWMYRANANLRSFGQRNLEYTPGWCAGWWFIPLMNLFKPYSAMKEIFENSSTLAKRDGVVATGVIGGWWACWLIGGFVTRIETRMQLQGIDLGSAQLLVTWLSTILTVGAAVLLINIMSRVSDWQETHTSGLTKTS